MEVTALKVYALSQLVVRKGFLFHLSCDMFRYSGRNENRMCFHLLGTSKAFSGLSLSVTCSSAKHASGLLVYFCRFSRPCVNKILG